MAHNGELTTFEEVEAYVDKLNAQQPEGAQEDLTVGIEKVCKYYKIVKPILNVVMSLPLIPEKIKKPIKDFMAILDTFCPA